MLITVSKNIKSCLLIYFFALKIKFIEIRNDMLIKMDLAFIIGIQSCLTLAFSIEIKHVAPDFHSKVRAATFNRPCKILRPVLALLKRSGYSHSD